MCPILGWHRRLDSRASVGWTALRHRSAGVREDLRGLFDFGRVFAVFPQVRESAPGGRKAQSAASGALGAEATPEGREDNHAGVRGGQSGFADG